MAAHIKHGVYLKSNSVCNKSLNNSFSISLMTSRNANSVITKALGEAKRLGMSQTDFADKVGVSSQTVTNWKRRKRMPPEHHQAAANALNWTVDKLLGLSQGEAISDFKWPFANIPFRDFDSLTYEQKIDIGNLLEDQIQRFKCKNKERFFKKSKVSEADDVNETGVRRILQGETE